MPGQGWVADGVPGAAGRLGEACYSCTGARLATFSDNATVQVWAHGLAQSDPHLLRFSGKLSTQPTALAWAPDDLGWVLAVGTRSGHVHILQHAPTPQNTPSQQQQQQQQESTSSWRWVGRLQCGKGAVSGLSFAPKKHGLLLAVAGQEVLGNPQSDSYITLVEGHSQVAGEPHWTHLSKFKACAGGPCTALCWRHHTPGVPPLLLCSHEGGAAVWCYEQASMAWRESCLLPCPKEQPGAAPATALHWAPTLNRQYELVAVAYGSEVVLLKLLPAAAAGDEGGVGPRQVLRLSAEVEASFTHPGKIWKLEFDKLGAALACSLDDRPEIWVWKPDMMGSSWGKVLAVVGDAGAAAGVQDASMEHMGEELD